MTKAEQVLQQLKTQLPDMPYYDDTNLELLDLEYGQVKEHTQRKDHRRWLTYQTTYWEFEDGSCLGIDWALGNTEYQESEGPHDIYLAESYEETITKYRRLNG